MSELYELPNGWSIEKFDDIKVSNVIGLVKSVKQQSPSLQYKYVKMNNITNDNGFTFDNIINVDATDEEVKKFNLQKGDFLFNTRNSAELVGKSCIFDYDMENILYNNNIMRVRFRDDVIPYFVSYQFNSRYIKEQLKEIISATTNVAAIYYKTLKEINVLIPPLSEQQRIVSKLDLLFEKIDKSIALHQKNMDEADVFMGSVLNDVFGELEEKYDTDKVINGFLTTDYVANGSFKSLKENVIYMDEKDYAILVRLTDYTAKWNGNYRYVTENSYKFLSKSSLNEDDILICNVGATIGTTFKVPNLNQPMTLGPNTILIRPLEDDMDNNFYFYYFKSDLFQSFIKNIASTTAQPKFNKTDLRNQTYYKPPISIQQKVVKYLDDISEKIEKIKSVQKEKMDSLKALKASILDKAFRGEL